MKNYLNLFKELIECDFKQVVLSRKQIEQLYDILEESENTNKELKELKLQLEQL